MLGKQAIFFHQGDYHMKLRKLVLRAFLPEAIKNIVSDIETMAKDSLQSWEGRLINTFQEMKTVSSLLQLLCFSHSVKTEYHKKWLIIIIIIIFFVNN